MSSQAAVATGCTVLALAAALGALRCLADRMLGSALVYAVLAAALIGGAVHAAVHAL